MYRQGSSGPDKYKVVSISMNSSIVMPQGQSGPEKIKDYVVYDCSSCDLLIFVLT